MPGDHPNLWRQCAAELTEAENFYLDGNGHEKYVAWVHHWTSLARGSLLMQAERQAEAAERGEAAPISSLITAIMKHRAIR